MNKLSVGSAGSPSPTGKTIAKIIDTKMKTHIITTISLKRKEG
jgi:hypothetical protein